MSKTTIFCIGRQYGSGGREIGEKLAKDLNIPFYDKELLKKAAIASGITEEMFERADEKPTDSFLYSLSIGRSSQNISFLANTDYLSNDNLFVIQANVIKDISKEGSCVIIGRCADYILRDQDINLISVFIHADPECRVKRLMDKYGFTESEATTKIRKTDKSRANYYNFYAENPWGVCNTYSLSLSSSALGVDGCVEMIKQFAEIKK